MEGAGPLVAPLEGRDTHSAASMIVILDWPVALREYALRSISMLPESENQKLFQELGDSVAAAPTGVGGL